MVVCFIFLLRVFHLPHLEETYYYFQPEALYIIVKSNTLTSRCPTYRRGQFDSRYNTTKNILTFNFNLYTANYKTI